MSKEQYRSQFRIPYELYETLKEEAELNNRSINAELVQALQDNFKPQLWKQSERRKLELLNEYVQWCNRKGKNHRESESEFRERYLASYEGCCVTHTGLEDGISPVSGVADFDPMHLGQMYGIWLVERPIRFPILADTEISQEIIQIREIVRAEAEKIADDFSLRTNAQLDSYTTSLEKRLAESKKNLDALIDAFSQLDSDEKNLVFKRFIERLDS